ncbi:SGNH/GDSL hydrolase family protein [Streptomyces jumonjinensis]|uniref:SGNH/GDSL hydrolase family protein n=1 Tax=Streptomyces jumonjinensis TaxID=1945 RepID=A0A646KT25_STRJU|nr:SGNH/GDSL hydrolase family protein [Streptomyces jumonjinensis]MQT05479.1 SGNH/GDSL hydrolase family protein [Streptomyces jumonjinensis]
MRDRREDHATAPAGRDTTDRAKPPSAIRAFRTARAPRPRRAAAVLTAAAVLATGVLTGCDLASEAQTSGAPARKPAPVWDRSPDSIAAVGDSITRAFDACAVLSDCPEASWATGTDEKVRSLATRLIGEPAVIADRTWNYARTGAEAADLTRQMTKAAAKKPDLVTVMVGANDACADSPELMTPVADFRASFTGALRELRRTAPKTQVYVSSVPDLKRLWSTGRDDPLGRAIWKLGICSTMLGDAEDLSAKAQQRRADVRDRVVAYNGVLKEVCGKDRRCRYDGGAVFDYRFSDDLLSRWDWFHPSKDGQGALAEIAYRNITAARPPG